VRFVEFLFFLPEFCIKAFGVFISLRSSGPGFGPLLGLHLPKNYPRPSISLRLTCVVLPSFFFFFFSISPVFYQSLKMGGLRFTPCDSPLLFSRSIPVRLLSSSFFLYLGIPQLARFPRCCAFFHFANPIVVHPQPFSFPRDYTRRLRPAFGSRPPSPFFPLLCSPFPMVLFFNFLLVCGCWRKKPPQT